MKVLVVGRGGREHALCQKIGESPLVREVFAAPGNVGMQAVAHLLPWDEGQQEALAEFTVENKIDLIIIGPEQPLLQGLADRLAQTGALVFAPTKKAAKIEGSKSFAKALMQKYGIPTAGYKVFTDYDSARAFVKSKGAPLVIKADGLAAGKGVVVAQSEEEALSALQEMLVLKKFGKASAKIVIEEYLEGEEFSLMALVHGETVLPLEPAQDHKRAYDGDLGPNTGGMGAYSPLPQLPEALVLQATEDILIPAARALVQEGRPFTGVLYAGLMLTKTGPQVIEFNARFGDPETQVVLLRLQSDLVEAILGLFEGETLPLQWKKEAALGVVLAGRGYPLKSPPPTVLEGLVDLSRQLQVFYSGVDLNEKGQYLAAGGRVFLAAALAPSVAQAQEEVYATLSQFHFPQLFYRRDIGKKAVGRKEK